LTLLQKFALWSYDGAKTVPARKSG
jgi:hypothetical protein